MAEKIFKREDGSRVKVTVRTPMFSSPTVWNVRIDTCEPGKRNFHGVIDINSWKFRGLSMKEREEYTRQVILGIVSMEEIDEVKRLALDEMSLLEYRYEY